MTDRWNMLWPRITPAEDRVDDWRKNGNFADVEEFVESIPFTETREYVQAIMRNAVIYKLLYSKVAASN